MKAGIAKQVRFIPFLLSLVLFLPLSSKVLGEDLELGKQLFEGKCARCHSVDGGGNPKMAKILKVPVEKLNLRRKKVAQMSPYQIEALVDSGNHRMPPYRGKLTDDQIHDVARYLVTLLAYEKQKESPAPK
jgi:mono/diheme cytochrome c family protein